MNALTKEQAELVANNHNLIYSFLNSKNLPVDDKLSMNIDDWYGIMAEALCKAAKGFDNSKSTNFSTYAYHCMQHAMINTFKGKNTLKEIPNQAVEYYDEFAFETGIESKMDYIPDTINIENQVIAKLTVNQFMEIQTDQRKRIFYLISIGYNSREIADLFGCCRQNIEKILQRARITYQKKLAKGEL